MDPFKFSKRNNFKQRFPIHNTKDCENNNDITNDSIAIKLQRNKDNDNNNDNNDSTASFFQMKKDLSSCYRSYPSIEYLSWYELQKLWLYYPHLPFYTNKGLQGINGNRYIDLCQYSSMW